MPSQQERPASADPVAVPGQRAETAPSPPQHHQVHRARISGTLVALSLFAVILLLLLIFILQNSRGVDLNFFGSHTHMPLGVAMLLAAVCGILLVALLESARIMRLRAAARRRGRDGPTPRRR